MKNTLSKLSFPGSRRVLSRTLSGILVVAMVAVCTSITLNATMATSSDSGRLRLNGASDSVALNSYSALYAVITTPASRNAINRNSNLVVNRICNGLTIKIGLLHVAQENSIPPLVTILQPAEDSVTKTKRISVIGTFNHLGATKITVNGISAAIQGNNFRAIVPLSEGQNRLLIATSDRAGTRVVATRIVSRDTTAPTIRLSKPAEAGITGTTQVSVIGTFSDATATTITVNGNHAETSGSAFNASINLQEGTNIIHVVATDAAGNQKEISRSFRVDTIGPDIEIRQPLDDVVVSHDHVTVTGTVEDPTLRSVTVNGIAGTFARGRFTAKVQLVVGVNRFRVSARDAAGNERVVTHTIEYSNDTTPPRLVIIEPANGTTRTSSLIVGRVVDEAPDYVKVGGNDKIDVAADGTFQSTVFLAAEGSNTFILVPVDRSRNRGARQSLTFTIDSTSPEITILTPVRDSHIDIGATSVRGMVRDASPTVVRVNGITTAVKADGSFKVDGVPIKEGGNWLEITATDAVGNVGEKSLLVYGTDRTSSVPPH